MSHNPWHKDDGKFSTEKDGVMFSRNGAKFKAVKDTGLPSGFKSVADELRGALDAEEGCDTPGKKKRSKGKGRGLARGNGKGPIGEPAGEKTEEALSEGVTSKVDGAIASVATSLAKKNIGMLDEYDDAEQLFGDLVEIVAKTHTAAFMRFLEKLRPPMKTWEDMEDMVEEAMDEKDELSLAVVFEMLVALFPAWDVASR